MSKYYISGYKPPEGVTDSEKVKEYQKQLGVTVDGIWGPKTQAAYDSYNSAQNRFMSYYDSVLSQISVPTVSVSIPSQEKISEDVSAFLRPNFDNAIEGRKQSGYSNMAEIDADAVARGMGSSTFVSSLKGREHNDMQNDIAHLESEYSTTLAKNIYDALNAYQKMALEADIFNAEAQSGAQNTALSIANTLYSAWLAEKSASSSSRSSSSSAKKQTAAENGLTEYHCLLYLSYLSQDELRDLSSSDDEYWAVRREELISVIGNDRFEQLTSPYGSYRWGGW